jgi:hypothetical protein
MRCPPQTLQDLREEFSVLWKVPILAAQLRGSRDPASSRFLARPIPAAPQYGEA